MGSYTKEEIQKEKLLLSPQTFHQFYLEGRLYYAEQLLTEKKYEELRSLVRLTQDIYTDAWDWAFNIQNKFVKVIKETGQRYDPKWDPTGEVITDTVKFTEVHLEGLFIYFEDIIIRNRHNRTHNIKELFIQLEFPRNASQAGSKDGLTLFAIKGGRTRFSYKEWVSEYVHSHLSQNSANISSSQQAFPYLTSFCTGSGEINIYRSNLNTDGFTEDNIQKFLLQLYTLATYESIEGTPYRYMSNISGRINSGSRFYYSNILIRNLWSRFIRYYITENLIPRLNFELDIIGLCKLKEDETFSKTLEDFPWSEDDKRRFFCYDAGSTIYAYGQVPAAVTGYNFPDRKFLFRGEEKKLQIDVEKLEVKDISYTLHPTLVKQLKDKINYELNKKTIRKSTIERYKNKNGDARKNISPDSILVSRDS